MNFKNIKINSSCGDIDIKEGSTFQIIGGTYTNNDDTLEIASDSDLTLVLTPMEVLKLEIKTDTGDANIELTETTIKSLSFISSSGDLNLDARVEFVNFNSHSGEYYFRNNHKPNKGKNTISVSETKTIKNRRNALMHNTSNERYE